MNEDLAIIIVSWNTGERLARCLDSVAGEPLEATSEIWVVDNASADGSVEMVRRCFPQVHLICNETNRGFAAACNQALACVRAPVVVLLNSDATPEPGALARLRDVLARCPDIGIVGPQLLGHDGRPQRSYGRIPAVRAFVAEMLAADRVPGVRRLVPSVASPPLRQEHPRPVGYVVGACLALRRELLDAVGPLDERFFLYFEETDFCLRVRRDAGALVWFDPAARVHHEGQASAAQLGPAAEIIYATSAYAFVRKHFGWRAARRLGVAFRLWLAAQAAVHRALALAGRPGAREALARKRRLRALHRSLGMRQRRWAA